MLLYGRTFLPQLFPNGLLPVSICTSTNSGTINGVKQSNHDRILESLVFVKKIARNVLCESVEHDTLDVLYAYSEHCSIEYKDIESLIDGKKLDVIYSLFFLFSLDTRLCAFWIQLHFLRLALI